ncbi:MAG TPA: aspartate kinase [Bacilli bacterium]|jgi:aspartate kinase|nr:aspartate kinase [Bacilli bacterium]
MLVVAKFGGSSVANTSQFQKVKAIVEAKENRKVIIVSALGKKEKNDSKITDLLYLLHAHLRYSVPYDNVFSMIKNRFCNIKEELQLKIDLESEFNQLAKELNKELSMEYLASRGEYITAKMVAEYLGYTFVDAKDLICFDYSGLVNDKETEKKINEAYQKYHKIVIPGFYGAYPNGTIKTFSRGGSDITGAIVAKALGATVYENWTDVSGILMADPKVIDNPKRINQITYNELRELSYMGASVLHEETVFPVQEGNIPINILNTNEPENPGTIITENCDDNSQIITGIAGKKHFTSFTVTKTHNADKLSVLRAVLNVFDKYKVNVEHIPTSIDSFSVVVANSDVEKCIYDLVSEINKNEEVKNIIVDNDISLIAVVGRNMVTKPGISGKVFGIIGNENINIKMIAQGSQELTIIVGVCNKDFEKTIKAVYDNLVN